MSSSSPSPTGDERRWTAGKGGVNDEEEELHGGKAETSTQYTSAVQNDKDVSGRLDRTHSQCPSTTNIDSSRRLIPWGVSISA
ncbi:unnamed protein product [Haemonchus placei]|uniref:Uncharacterized protein n=1 Tax=Haemonchus placei TaxID=6290 RepID=A0A0N4X893_HAEPC|nr:unnamed protein product [Haemonchus placei]